MAATWVERRKGAYLRTWLSSFRYRKALVGELEALDVQPMGYGDRADVVL